ncbi:hypothetical protein [Mesorhizobium sangaii]|uniref:Nuclease n=1 Tax=Mesorhizobium sangaii TaxID=505389 RepID=A0A841PFG2_9HYPH|nr:hypothetical protein [Mesorhizobium sangaii]
MAKATQFGRSKNTKRNARRSVLKWPQLLLGLVMVLLGIAAYFGSDGGAALSRLPLPGSVLHADPITGIASVIDGDTIELHGQRVRFNGMTRQNPRNSATMQRASAISAVRNQPPP